VENSLQKSDQICNMFERVSKRR